MRPIVREDLRRIFPPQYGEERTPATLDAYEAFLDGKASYLGQMMAFQRCPAWLKASLTSNEPVFEED